MLNLDDIRKSSNIVELLYETDDGKRILQKIGRSVVRGCEIDDKSAESWKRANKEAMDIAKQITKKKTFPWDGAANLKYPLITEASVNFASRTYPELVPNNDIVEMVTTGDDPDGEKFQRAQRVGECLSYQCASSSDWKIHLDRLLHILPVIGTAFTKIYYSDLEDKNCVELVPPDRIIINHDTTISAETARRITHIISMSINDIVSHQRMGLYCECEIDKFRPQDCDPDDEDYEIDLYEQHCWLDLDEDGYKEPYVITVHPETNYVLRIVNRIEPGSIKRNKEKKIIKINAMNFWQDYHFIRSPDGGFYSIGYGQLLLPLNKAINSITNQLIDAGTLGTTQGGFLGRGLRLKAGSMRFSPFEWKICDAASGMDIKQNIYPFPVREPSQVLLSLLTFLVNEGKALTASTDAMNGSMNATNVANNTLDNLIEQGKTTLKAINKRLYESLTESFKKLYKLNYYYLSDKEYQNILDQQGISVKKDFDLNDYDIRPIADPELSTMDQRLKKGSVLMNMKTLDPRAVEKYIIQSMQFDNSQVEKFQPPPDPNAPPPPEAVKMMSEAKLNDMKAQDLQFSLQTKAQTIPMDLQKAQKEMQWTDAQIQESASRVFGIMKDKAHNDQKILITGSKMVHQEQLKQVEAQYTQLKNQMDAILKQRELNIQQDDNTMKAAIDLKRIAANIEINKDKNESQKTDE